MLSKYGLLNLLVLSVVLLLTLKNYEVWTKPINWVPEKEVRNKPEAPPNLEKGNTPASFNSSIPIAEKNIFSPERKDFPTTTTAMMQTKKPIARPQIVLYGVTIVEDYQSAIVVNPGRVLRKEERESMTLKIGEKIGEYKLAKILPDRIAMENNGDTFEVLLYDSKKPKKRIETKTETKPPDGATPPPAPSVPSEASLEKPKELAPERVTPSSPIQFRGDNLPIHVFSRQARSALISQNNASRK